MEKTPRELPKPIDDLRKARRWPKGVPMPKPGAYSSGARWTYDEEQLLRRHYPKYGGFYCARLLGRSLVAVRTRARGLKLTAPRFWSDTDIARLKLLYGTMPNAKLARMFGRDTEQMLQKARLLGLRTAASRWSKKELSILRSQYGTVPVKQIAERLGRPHGSVLQLAQRLGLSTKRTPMTRATERAIVKQVKDRVPITRIAEQFHTTTLRIHKIARAYGCELIPGARPDSWQQVEDEFLRKHYSTMRAADIAQHLGRGATSVHVRARQLGIPLAESYGARQIRWSAADERMLRKYYGKMVIEDLADQLGRSVKAVHAHARDLGLSLRAANPALPQLWTSKEDATLRRLFQIRTNPQIAELLGRPLRSVISRAKKLGLKKERPGFKEWTAREDGQLRQLHRTLKPAEIAERLGRTLASVRKRMYTSGLLTVQKSKPPVWTADEDQLLKKLYGRQTIAEIASRLGRSANAVKLRANRMGMHASVSHSKQEP